MAKDRSDLPVESQEPRVRLRLWLAAAFAAALGVRLAYVSTLPAELRWDDARIYVTVARNAAAGKGLVQAPGEREASKAPGYPAFLLLLRPRGDERAFLQRVRGTQCLVGAGLVFLVGMLAARLFGDTAGAAAAWIAALYPFFVYYCGVLLSETLFTTCFVAAFLCLDGALWPRATARQEGRGHRWRAAGAGLLFGIATLVRASALLVLPFAFLAAVLAGRKRFRPSSEPAPARVIEVFAVAVLGLLLALAPWGIRNYRRFGALVLTTLQTGESLYEGCSPYATGGPAWHLVDWEGEGGGTRRSEYENDRFWRRKAVDWIRRNPGRFLYLALVKEARFWNPIPNNRAFRTPFCVTVSLVSYGPVLVLAILGVARSRRRWRRGLVLLSPVVYYALVHAVFVSSIRYRTPVMPFLMCFSGFALATLVRGRPQQPGGAGGGGARSQPVDRFVEDPQP